jgi:hypothetical protein
MPETLLFYRSRWHLLFLLGGIALVSALPLVVKQMPWWLWLSPLATILVLVNEVGIFIRWPVAIVIDRGNITFYQSWFRQPTIALADLQRCEFGPGWSNRAKLVLHNGQVVRFRTDMLTQEGYERLLIALRVPG